MATTRRQQFVNGQLVWMLASVLVLALADALTLELYVLVSFIGLMLLTLATAPVNVRPRWRARLRWPIALGFLVFAYLVLSEVIQELQTVL